MDFAALFSVQLHFLLDNREDRNLLVLVEHAIPALIEDFDELVGGVQAQQVIDVLFTLLEH